MKRLSDPAESPERTLEMAGNLADAMSKHLEKFAVQIVGISFDEFERGMELVGGLIEAGTLDRVIEVEADYLQSAHRAFYRHALRLGDLYAALSAEPATGAAAARFGATG